MDRRLLETVRQRVDADATLEPEPTQLIIAACTGCDLDDAPSAAWPDPADNEAGPPPDSAVVFISDITVEGFRGIGPERTLSLEPGPGLTQVVGRNGSGKSSFAEGLEMCLTGQPTRWTGRPKAWAETWRNLHHPEPATVQAGLVGLDQTPRTLSHRWAEGAGLDDGVGALADGRTPIDLGWIEPLAQYRPMLSFNELGGMFNGKPSVLYDAIAEILGVQPLRDAVERLRGIRLDGAKPMKQVKATRQHLVEQLRASNDARAELVLAGDRRPGTGTGLRRSRHWRRTRPSRRATLRGCGQWSRS